MMMSRTCLSSVRNCIVCAAMAVFSQFHGCFLLFSGAVKGLGVGSPVQLRESSRSACRREAMLKLGTKFAPVRAAFEQAHQAGFHHAEFFLNEAILAEADRVAALA